MQSNNSSPEPHSPLDCITSFMHNRWLMAKKSLNMIEKMMDPNIIYYYIINCTIPSIITIENRYQIDFGKPGYHIHVYCLKIIKKFRFNFFFLFPLVRNMAYVLGNCPSFYHTSENRHNLPWILKRNDWSPPKIEAKFSMSKILQKKTFTLTKLSWCFNLFCSNFELSSPF